MPCRTEGPYEPYDSRQRLTSLVANLSAALCAVLTVVEANGEIDDLFNAVDYKEAGIPEGFIREWWAKHQEEDRIRKQREKEEAERKRLRQKALEKLTPKERAALGV